MSDKNIYKIADGFMLREIAGNYVVVAVGNKVKEFNGVINLNETGAFLWKNLSDGISKEDLVKKMLSEYDIDEDTAKNDVNKFIDKLAEAKLLK